MSSRRAKNELLELSNKMTSKLNDLMAGSPQSADQCDDVIQRGKDIQKRLKSSAQQPITSTVPVHVCRMRCKRGGNYCREGMSVEIFCTRTDSYDSVVNKACFSLSMSKTGSKFSLFTANGAMIVKQSTWTLGEYLQRVHKSEARFGVGEVFDVADDHRPSTSGIVNDYEGSSLPHIHSDKSSDLELSDSQYKDSSILKRAKSPVTLSDDDFELRTKSVKKKKFNKVEPGRALWNPAPTIDSGSCMQFYASELAAATRDYSRCSQIGKGGFGTVYKGNLRRSLDVAIKVLSQEGKKALRRSQATQQLQSEVSVLNRFRHPNILQLYGYCAKPLALVFEYMVNGSLYDQLHRVNLALTDPLSWDKRKMILIDACRGLVYLHGAEPPLSHQDIKSANILLDANLNAKLADFGFSVELPQLSGGMTMFSSTCLARSEGYYPSEITSGHYSDRSDVYSYGVVILETYTRQLVYDRTREDKKLVDHVQDDITSLKSFAAIQDSVLLPIVEKEVKKVFDILTLCLKRHSKRPTSLQVLTMWSD